jgi:hypothetical protein
MFYVHIFICLIGEKVAPFINSLLLKLKKNINSKFIGFSVIEPNTNLLITKNVTVLKEEGSLAMGYFENLDNEFLNKYKNFKNKKVYTYIVFQISLSFNSSSRLLNWNCCKCIKF